MAADRIEGYAIVSADGMIADAAGRMPAALTIEADQRFFHAALDRAACVVHGRHSCEGGPNAPSRRRLILTRSVAALAPHCANPRALLWNPAGAALEEALRTLGAPAGMLAVIGGADAYEVFWRAGYDAFHLSRVATARLPGGRPVFRQVGPNRTPEEVLASHDLHPCESRVLQPDVGATLVTWVP
jgi:dihydrofolate reductase